jgi:heme o synthase
MNQTLTENSSAQQFSLPNVRSVRSQKLRDYVELTKPRITLFCVLMTWGGMALHPHKLTFSLVLFTLLGTVLSVASANALNMFWEREGDKSMARTRRRPLPSGRLDPWQALVFAIILGILSLVVFVSFVNMLTAVLSLLALLSYVLVYTPMKRVSSLALVVGSFPGAMPPLLGWTAVSNELSAGGLVLFAILFIWQIPHFIAISFTYQKDYENAGIKTVPSQLGAHLAKLQSLAYSIILIPISLLLVPLGISGSFYFVTALLLGLWFAYLALAGFKKDAGHIWSRQFFRASLIYLPALTLALVSDILLNMWFAPPV